MPSSSQYVDADYRAAVAAYMWPSLRKRRLQSIAQNRLFAVKS